MPGAVTVIDGGRRAASFVLDEGLDADNAQPLQLLLGVNPVFSSRHESGLFC